MLSGNQSWMLNWVTFVVLLLQGAACTGQAVEKEVRGQARTVFPQVHTNLNGMVREFVRTMYRDKRGNFWFGTNGDGIIRYDGERLEKMRVNPGQTGGAVRAIVEDEAGQVWFGTSFGLVRYDGTQFTTYSTDLGLQDEEVWGLTVDDRGVIWVGTTGGVSHFDGDRFVPFALPDQQVENPEYMLSEQLVRKFMQDSKGTMWLVTDGNGIFKYKEGIFTHLTAQQGLTDNSVADVFEDSRGNTWIGTYYGGVSKFDGQTFINFTQDGVVEGVETYNFCEDRQGNVWFSAENHGVYRYDGSGFTQFTTDNGLATNTVQSIFEDDKGQLWLGTWQGISIFDGQQFVNAADKAPWTN